MWLIFKSTNRFLRTNHIHVTIFPVIIYHFKRNYWVYLSYPNKSVCIPVSKVHFLYYTSYICTKQTNIKIPIQNQYKVKADTSDFTHDRLFRQVGIWEEAAEQLSINKLSFVNTGIDDINVGNIHDNSCKSVQSKYLPNLETTSYVLCKLDYKK